MKAIVKTESSELEGNEYKVKRINYDNVVLNVGGRERLKEFHMDEVELTGENKVEDIIIENKDLLKIKILRGVPQKFYEILTNELEKFIGEELKSINILVDEYRTVGKRNLWEKECYLMINDKYPIYLSVNGKKFKNKDFYFSLEEVEKEKFLEISNFEIEKIKNKMKLYGENLREVTRIKHNITNSEKIKL